MCFLCGTAVVLGSIIVALLVCSHMSDAISIFWTRLENTSIAVRPQALQLWQHVNINAKSSLYRSVNVRTVTVLM